MVCVCMQEAEGNLERVQCELAETRQRGDLELTRVGDEYDATKQSLEDLEVGPFDVLSCRQARQAVVCNISG